MPCIHLTTHAVPHPAVSMLGRSVTADAARDELPIASDSPVWKLHAFSRGLFHWQVGDRELRIPAGHWLLIPPGVAHGGVGHTRERGVFYWMHLKPDRIWPGFHSDEMTSLLPVLTPGLYPASSELATAWEDLLGLAQGNDPFRRGHFACRSGLLLHTLLADMDAHRTHSSANQRCKRIRDYIETHLDLPLRNEHLAEMAGLRRSQFSHLFKAETGLTPQDYIQTRRLERAKTLLREGQHSILDIALEVGFSSSQAFATTFKRACGTTPTQWKNLVIQQPVP